MSTVEAGVPCMLVTVALFRQLDSKALCCLQIAVPDSVTDESASQFLVNPGEQRRRRHVCACTRIRQEENRLSYTLPCWGSENPAEDACIRTVCHAS